MKTTKLILLLASILLLSACSTKDVEPEYFNIDATEASMPDSKAGSTDILLATNCNPTVTVEESAAGWLSAAITRRCLTLTCTENPDPEERTGKALVVAGSTQVSITVTQPGHVDEPDEPEEPEDPDEPATSYELYDVYYENGQAVGIVFWAAEDNLSALVVSLDRSEIVPWSYDGTHTIGTGTSDGAANTELLRASEEAADIPALVFCDQHGEGWYWPSLGELQTLFEAYNGTTYDEATKSVPASITDEEKAARAAFDKLLTDNGGTAMNLAAESENGDAYWSSTEQIYQEVTYGSSFRFGKAYASGGGDQQIKTKSSRYVRCIKAVTVGGSVEPDDPDVPVETKFPVYQENGKNVGIIYWTSEDGKTSKVLSLKRVEGPWSYNGANILGAASLDDGAANTAVLKASAEAADIPALALCESLGEEWYKEHRRGEGSPRGFRPLADHLRRRCHEHGRHLGQRRPLLEQHGVCHPGGRQGLRVVHGLRQGLHVRAGRSGRQDQRFGRPLRPLHPGHQQRIEKAPGPGPHRAGPVVPGPCRRKVAGAFCVSATAGGPDKEGGEAVVRRETGTGRTDADRK